MGCALRATSLDVLERTGSRQPVTGPWSLPGCGRLAQSIHLQLHGRAVRATAFALVERELVARPCFPCLALRREDIALELCVQPGHALPDLGVQESESL